MLMYLFFKIRNMWCFLALQNNLCLFALFLLFYYQQNTRYFDLFCIFLLAHFEQFCPTCVKLTLKTQIKFKFQPAIKFASVVADHMVESQELILKLLIKENRCKNISVLIVHKHSSNSFAEIKFGLEFRR